MHTLLASNYHVAMQSTKIYDAISCVSLYYVCWLLDKHITVLFGVDSKITDTVAK